MGDDRRVVGEVVKSMNNMREVDEVGLSEGVMV